MAPRGETPLPYILSHGSDGLYSGMRLAIPGLNGESFTFSTLPQMIETIRKDSNGRDVEIRLYASITETGVLDIGAGQARFENSGTETWGHITFTGSIRSGSTGWATVYLNGVSAEIQAEIHNDDGSALSVGNDSIVNITSGHVSCNASSPAYFAVNSFGNSSVSITGGKVWATFGGTPVYIADSSTVEISGTPEIKAKDNTQEAVVMKTADGGLTLGGSPDIYGSIGAWVGKLAVDNFTPGQNRYTLTMKGTPGVGDIAVQSGKDFIRNFKLANENLYLTTSTVGNDLLVTNIKPSPTNYVITGSGGSFSVTYGGGGGIPLVTGTLNEVIQGIGVDAMGEPCTILFGDGSATLDIGTGTATFANASGSTWGEITLSGKITSASDSATVRMDGITLSSNADIANSGRGDGITLVPKGGTLNITGGNVSAISGSAVSNLLPIGFGVNSVLNISGTSVLSSANYQPGVNELEGGTLYVTTGTEVNISGGTIRNTAAGNAVFSNGHIALGGTPHISGPIRIYTPYSKMSVDSSFLPGSKTYPLTVYELSGSIIDKVVVAGGAAFSSNFSLINKGYELAVSGNDLVVGLAAKKISLAPAANKDFGSAAVGYAAPTAHSVAVSNAGTEATGDLTIALSGADAASFILSKNAIASLATDGTDSFTVAPKKGLSAKTYNATVTVSGGADIIAQSFVVTFNVVENGTTPTATEITGFAAIPNVNAGTAGSATYANAAAVIAALPTSVTANYSGGTAPWPVTTWEDTDGYNANEAGSYTFTADLGTAPSGYANSAGHTCTVEVVVSPADSTTYTVTFNPNGGNVSPAGAETGADGKLTSLPTPTRSKYRFDGWFTAVSGGTQITTDYVFTANTTIYAHWTYTGGSGGSSSGSTAQPTAPAADGAVKVNYTSSNGTAVLSLPAAKVNDIIKNCQGGAADIDLSKVSGITAAELPKAALSAMNEAGLDITLKLPAGTITLGEDAAASILEQATGSNLSIELQPAATGSLTPAQQEAVQSGDLVLDINILSGTKKIAGFDGTLSVQAAYNGPQPVAVWYLNDKGDLEKVNCTFKDGIVSFDLDHLSLYVVGQDTKEAAQENSFSDVLPG
ncbi:MAG: InlB B-repeat-containing protein, partial [Syntrophomonas sp.]